MSEFHEPQSSLWESWKSLANGMKYSLQTGITVYEVSLFMLWFSFSNKEPTMIW